MEERMKKISRLFEKKGIRFRYGSGAVLLSLLVVFVCVLIVLLADTAEEKWALTADLSFNSATVQSEQTDRILSSLDKNVHVILVSDGTSDADSLYGETDTLRMLLKRFSAGSNHFSYSEQKLVNNPSLVSRYRDSLGKREISDHCLIICCEETDRARILDSNDFYVLSYDSGYNVTVSGFQYEKAIMQAVLSVTSDTLPCVQVLCGHGEVSRDQLAAFEQKMYDAAFSVSYITLSEGDVPDPGMPLFIFSPKYDLSSSDADKLIAFAERGGDLFVTYDISADLSSLPVFDSLLLSWGISPAAGVVVADADTDGYWAQKDTDEDRLYILPVLVRSDNTSALLSAGEDRYLMIGARAFTENNTDNSNVQLQNILVTDRAWVRDYSDGLDTVEMQAGDLYGNLAVALLSTKVMPSGERSELFISGNTVMFTEQWMYDNTSSASLMLYITQSMSSVRQQDLSIIPRSAVREGLSFSQLTLPMILVFAIPFLILIIALIILIPRKHR